MHDWSQVHRDDGFGGQRSIAKGAVRAFSVVVFPPFFDDDLGFTQAVEDLATEQFIP